MDKETEDSPIEQQKRFRKEQPLKYPNDETELLQRKRVAILKERLRNLDHRHQSLPYDARDPERDVYAFELRAFLRRKKLAQWPCPALDCSQSYARKSHMKAHIMASEDAGHQIVKSVIAEIHCSYCGDKARDALVIALQQNGEVRYVPEPHLSGSTIPSYELPLVVGGGYAYSPDDIPGQSTLERKLDTRDLKDLEINPNLNRPATDGLPCSSISSHSSNKSPEPRYLEVPGTNSQSASESQRQTAQVDGTLILTAVNKLKAESPSSALFPIDRHLEMPPSSHYAFDMDMQNIRHSSLIRKREDMGYVSSLKQGVGLRNHIHHTMGHAGPLSGAPSASDYATGPGSLEWSGRSYDPQGSLPQTSGWQSAHCFNGFANNDYTELTAPSTYPFGGIKTEACNNCSGFPDNPQHSVRLDSTQASPCHTHQLLIPSPSWVRNPSSTMSMYEGPFVESTLVQGLSNPQNLLAEKQNLQEHHMAPDYVIKLESSTTG